MERDLYMKMHWKMLFMKKIHGKGILVIATHNKVNGSVNKYRIFYCKETGNREIVFTFSFNESSL